jgi:hypothetical protein
VIIDLEGHVLALETAFNKVAFFWRRVVYPEGAIGRRGVIVGMKAGATIA